MPFKTAICIFLFGRIGDNVKLKVNDAVEKESGFIDTFVIDQDSSVLFVGAPPVGFTLPAGVQTTSLVGGFNQLYINGRKVGLYDVKVNFSLKCISLLANLSCSQQP